MTVDKALTLAIWTIYDHPQDYPQYYVARKWLVGQPTQVVLTDSELQRLRDRLPAGLYRMPRSPEDDPCIVEVWL